MQTSTINIIGMHCNGCVSSVSQALEKLSGVTKVTVDLDQGVAQVTFDETKTSRQALDEAIEDAGFEIRPTV